MFLVYIVVGIALMWCVMYFLTIVVALLTGHDQIERNSTTVIVDGSETAVLRAAEETLKKNGFSNITHNPESGVLIGSYRLGRVAPLRFAVRDRGDGSCDLTVSGAYKRAVHNIAKMVPVEYARLNPNSAARSAATASAATTQDRVPREPVAAPTAPAGWLVDPTGRHQMRYWDSTRWTEHVANDGAPGVDAI